MKKKQQIGYYPKFCCLNLMFFVFWNFCLLGVAKPLFEERDAVGMVRGWTFFQIIKSTDKVKYNPLQWTAPGLIGESGALVIW